MVIKGYKNADGEYIKAKMSKSLGNVVAPAEIQAKYGSDTARLFILFAAPPEKELDWSDEGVEGSYRFLNRVYRLVFEYIESIRGDQREFPEPVCVNEQDKSLNFMLNSTIKKVGEDAGGRFNFNTAIASIMELVNEMYKYKQHAEMNLPLFNKAIETLLTVLNPFTPHITEEMWNQLGHEDRLYAKSWPVYDESKLVLNTVTIIVQVNGKMRGKIEMPSGTPEEEIKNAALEIENVKQMLEGKQIRKMIVVPNKIVNIVAA
jgi:leucyl-tRNA synthetase